MGGHNAGDVASEMAVLQLGNSWTETAFSQLETARKWLHKAINKENKRIYDAATAFKDLDGMGTTMVTAAFLDGTILISNVGDSRAYLFDGKNVELVTEDHSFANELRIQGQISEEEALIHDKKNTLTRSLGVGSEVAVDFFERSTTDIEVLLLCSDGLSNTVSNEEMEEILSKDVSLQKKSEELLAKASENGGTDNISVCLVTTNNQEEMKGGNDNGER